jgi:transmembrane sensor
MSVPIEPERLDGDAPLSATVVDQAAEWIVKLWSGVATPEDYRACNRWRAVHVDHERAWRRLQALDPKLELVPRSIAREVLKQRVTSRGRRRTLKTLGALFTGGAAAYVARQTPVWQRYAADYRTQVGEARTLLLSDSTQVALNTASAFDVRFDQRQRLVELRTGEIMLTTAPDPSTTKRPFIVTTAHGTVRALGTRFTVRQTDDRISHVAVLDGAVSIEPNRNPAGVLQLQAGQQTTFSTSTARRATAVDETSHAWVNGSLIVERMRLDAFLQELARYRPGLLRCDPAVGHYLLTGVYSLPDTDRILASIAKALPVQTLYRSRYWVTVTAR